MKAHDLDILYQDDQFLALNKPAGLLTQGPPEIDSVEARVRNWLRSQRGSPQDDTKHDEQSYVGLPHRLDRPVSGVLLIGLDRGATKHLANQFERREIEKCYWALVERAVEPTHGTWTDYMRKLPGEARSEVVERGRPDAQIAVLRYKVLCPFDKSTLVEIRLETGRTHQIRVQAASRGHPVLGDLTYGSTVAFGPLSTDLRQRHIALHARMVRLSKSPSGGPWHVTAPLSAAWLAAKEIKQVAGDVG